MLLVRSATFAAVVRADGVVEQGEAGGERAGGEQVAPRDYGIHRLA